MPALSSKGRFHAGVSFTADLEGVSFTADMEGVSFTADLEGVLRQIWREFYGRSGGCFTKDIESLYRHYAL